MIKIDGLTKIYNNNTKKAVTAVDNLNLEIKDGSIVGLLGPNGSIGWTRMNSTCGLTRL